MGKGPIQSIPTDCHGWSGIGSECRRPASFWVESFVVWHEVHKLQNSSISVPMEGHQ